MSPPSVVECFDVFEDFRLGVIDICKSCPVDEFLFEGTEEALDWSIVPTIALLAHADRDAPCLEFVRIGFGCVLTASV